MGKLKGHHLLILGIVLVVAYMAYRHYKKQG